MNIKLNKLTISIFIFISGILLVFLSKTIYTHDLPNVNAAMPSTGNLNKEEFATGTAVLNESEKLYSPVGAHVSQLNFKVGDKVKKDDILFSLEFDKDEVNNKLADIALDIELLRLEKSDIEWQIDTLKDKIELLNDKDLTHNLTQNYDQKQLALDIESAIDEVNDTRQLHKNGEATDQELDAARHKLQGLYLKEEYLKDSGKESIEEKEEGRKEKLVQYENEITTFESSLKAKELRLKSLGLTAEPYRKSLEDFDSYTNILAPSSGVITSIPVSKGEKINSDQLIAEIAPSTEVLVECIVPQNNDFISINDRVYLKNAKNSFEGIVSNIEVKDEGKKITVKIKTDKTLTGESFSLEFHYKSKTTYTLVPNSAVNKDSDGHFVNLIQRREGIMGQEYYLKRLNVYVGFSDSKNTAITAGITFFEPLLLSSDKIVESGDTVLLENEVDFFDKNK